MESITEALNQSGFFIKPDVLSNSEVQDLLQVIPSQISGAGARNLFRTFPEISSLAASPAIRSFADGVLGPKCFAVRAILFDKSPEANWKVTWHQDLAIAVQSKVEVPEYGPWSVKDGVPHVHAPTSLLEQMITLRVHLDDCTANNGPLRVIPGSHRHGKLSPEQIEEWRTKGSEVVCTVPKGGILLMRPLLLHASSKADSPAHRRVIHLEYAASDLPNGLEWHDKIESPYDPAPDHGH